MTMSMRRSVRGLLIALATAGISLSVAQRSAAGTGAEEVRRLLAELSSKSIKPADALDPTLAPSDRTRNLAHFSAGPYDLKLVPIGSVSSPAGDVITTPIRVHYDAQDGNSLETDATARFVRRNGTWYFADFGFMAWPAAIIIVVIGGVLIGIGWATTVLVLRSRLAKRGQLSPAASAKVFVPLFWPSLFRQTR